MDYLFMLISSLLSATLSFLFITYIFRNSKNEKNWVLGIYSIIFVSNVALNLLMVINETKWESWLIFALSALPGIVPYIFMSKMYGFGIKSGRRTNKFTKKTKKEPAIVLYTGKLRIALLIITIGLVVGFSLLIILKYVLDIFVSLTLVLTIGVLLLLFIGYYIYQWRYNEEQILLVIGKETKNTYLYTGKKRVFKLLEKKLFIDQRYIVDYGGKVLKKVGMKINIYHYYIVPNNVDDYQVGEFIQTKDGEYCKYQNEFNRLENKIIRD